MTGKKCHESVQAGKGDFTKVKALNTAHDDHLNYKPHQPRPIEW